MLYQWQDMLTRSRQLQRETAHCLAEIFQTCVHPLGYKTPAARALGHNESARNQSPSAFKLRNTQIRGQVALVDEEVLLEKPFGRLIHFKCETGSPRHVPKVLVVAPISGYKATILRSMVRDLLPDNDIYLTDWKDARDVPLNEGLFDLDDNTAYVQDFLRETGPLTHIIGISQSTIPVLCATSLMAARKESCTPLSMTLKCGPIHPLINETDVSRHARQHGLHAIRNSVIMPVPSGYPGAGRLVYPGFIQQMGLNAAMNNPFQIISDLFSEQGEKLDADAPFYLDMIRKVFIEHHLPQGIMTWRDEKVDPGQIKNTGLFVIEGSKDNVTASGQTKAAFDLCHQIPPHLKHYHLEHGAGHFDMFSGPHWEGGILNKYNDFTRKIAEHHGITYDPLHADPGAGAAVRRQSAKPELAA